MAYRSLFIVASLVLSSCSSHKETVTAVEPDYFIFGSGGGFTGKYTEYKVHNDGTIEQMNFDNEEKYEPYATVEAKEVQIFFAELEQLNLQEANYDKPGNMTWYIEVHDESGPNRIRWGDYNARPIGPDIEAFFKRVHDFVLSKKP